MGMAQSGGLSVPWSVDLRVTEGGEFFAATVGLSDVEVGSVGDAGTLKLRSLPRPDSDDCAFVTPVSILPIDLDRDGSTDLLVHDLCGAYGVLDATTPDAVATLLDQFLPQDGPYEFVDAWTAGESAEIASGSMVGYSFFGSQPAKEAWSFVGTYSIDTPASVKTKRGAVPVPGSTEPEWLLVGSKSVERLRRTPEGEETTNYGQGEPPPPFLEDFESFDDLQVIGRGACGLSAVAAGRFDPHGGVAPATPLLLSLPDDRDELELSPFDLALDVAAMATAEVAGRLIVGVLGRRPEGTVFTAFEVEPCGGVVEIGSLSTEISERRAPMPYFGQPPPSRLDQNRLVAVSRGERAIFVTYDGYTAKTYLLDQLGEGFSLTEVTTEVHLERNDLAFP